MLVETLQRAIVNSGLTHYRIGKDCGIHPSIITRFVEGERYPSLETADKLCKYFKLRLVKR